MGLYDFLACSNSALVMVWASGVVGLGIVCRQRQGLLQRHVLVIPSVHARRVLHVGGRAVVEGCIVRVGCLGWVLVLDCLLAWASAKSVRILHNKSRRH